MRARLRSLRHDLGRTARGAAAWVRYLFTVDRLDLALGALAVEGEGPGCLCRLRVANASPWAREATLVLELVCASAGEPTAGTRFTKRLRVPPLGLTKVELELCVGAPLRLRVDGLPAPLDGDVTGTPPTAGPLSIRARLLEEGRELHPPLAVSTEPAP